MDRPEWKCFVDELKAQWRSLWQDRIDDKERAEGIANKNYSSLFVERGTVIVATRDYRPLDFAEILEKHRPTEVDNIAPPNPHIGGWGKFARTALSRQKRSSKQSRIGPPKLKRDKDQQRRKGGKGWLRFKMK